MVLEIIYDNHDVRDHACIFRLFETNFIVYSGCVRELIVYSSCVGQLRVQLLSKIFIDSDFVIIIYIPYTCLRVCYKHMPCLMYNFFLSLHEQNI